MKTYTQNSAKLISIIIIMAAPLFLNNSWKKAAKTTFKERVLAEAAAGKKVAVFTNLAPLSYTHSASSAAGICQIGKGRVIPQSSTSTFSFTSWFDENTPVDYDVSSTIADQLNKGMDTDAFVPVAQDGVGTKTITALGIDSEVQDWWSSDYNIIVEVNLAATYITSGTSTFKTSLDVSPLMYVREKVEGKEALGVLVNVRAMGSNSTTAVEHTECYSSLDDLKTNVGTPDGLIAITKEGIAEPLAKFIDKQNEKYDKAMKKKKK